MYPCIVNKKQDLAPFVRIAVVAVLIVAGFFAVTTTAVATVGGPTYIYDFRYNPANESVYYISASQSGRGCPPILRKLSVRTGESETVFSCEQGEALLSGSAFAGQYPAPLFQKFEEITGRFERLAPLNLPKNNVEVDLTFTRTEDYAPDLPEIKRTYFLAEVYHNGTKAAEFPIAGCSSGQPFMFAGYIIPGVSDNVALLRSAKSDCFEGGYTGESLYIIDGISGLNTTYPVDFSKWNEPLVPSEATLVVFEKDTLAKQPVTVEDKNVTLSDSDFKPEKQGGLLGGDGQSAIAVLLALLCTIVGIVLGRTVFRKKSVPESKQHTESTNISSTGGLVIIWIIIFVVLLGGGYWGYRYLSTPKYVCWPYCPGMTDQDREDIKKSAFEAQTSDWKTYRNEEYGFEFKYHPDFSVVTDKVHTEYIGHPKGFNWYRVELTDASAREKPFLRFEVDPDGYGPFFPDKSYKILENSEGRIRITAEEAGQSEHQNDAKTLIIPNILQSQNGHTYYWQFSFDEGGADLEPMFKQILSTFRFTGTSSVVTSSWKTYRNEKYGFEFKYPADWTIHEVIPDKGYMNEPWRSFEFYASYTNPERSHDHAGFVGVSKKSVGELGGDVLLADARFFTKNGFTYTVTTGKVGPTFTFTK